MISVGLDGLPSDRAAHRRVPGLGSEVLTGRPYESSGNQRKRGAGDWQDVGCFHVRRAVIGGERLSFTQEDIKGQRPMIINHRDANSYPCRG